MATQNKTGKAFEYSILNELFNILSTLTKVEIIKNTSFEIAQNCYNSFNTKEQKLYQLNSIAAVKYLIDIEPKLSNSDNPKDILQLEIVSDSIGQSGDVRDVLLIRSVQNWVIGISAKNNHKAVKHSRLSMNIDFGSKWIGIPCSDEYYKGIQPIFTMLKDLHKQDKNNTWDIFKNKESEIYIPILNAFKNELEKIYKQKPDTVPQKLVEYLIGNKDFYKVIKGKDKVEIQAYNLHGDLGMPFNSIKPKANITRIKLPTRLIEIVFKEDSKTTLLLSFNEGWQISFRIHSAKSTIEPSLKFDINLVSTPQSLITNHIFINEK